jgi:hypothetical protein
LLSRMLIACEQEASPSVAPATTFETRIFSSIEHWQCLGERLGLVWCSNGPSAVQILQTMSHLQKDRQSPPCKINECVCLYCSCTVCPNLVVFYTKVQQHPDIPPSRRGMV